MTFKNSSRGFTTVEIAIVMIISGIILSIFLRTYSAFRVNQEYNETLEHLEQIDVTLNGFVQEYGRYPCPADPTLPPTHADYGLETRCGDFELTLDGGACTAGQRPLLPSSGLQSNVLCTNTGSRDTDGDGVTEMVLIGILPFRTLSLEAANFFDDFREYAGLDGYDMRFTYAVTETMADRGRDANAGTGVTPQMGAIKVVDENGNDVTTPPDSAHYVLVSHGKNRRGAYTEFGTQTQNCNFSTWIIPTGPLAGTPISAAGVDTPLDPNFAGSGLSLEIENCDHSIDADATNDDAIFRQAISSGLEDQPQYFDDIVYYRNTYSTNIWQGARNTDGLSGQRFLYNTNIGNVGVGDNFKAPISKLHILGDLVITDDNPAGNTSEPLILSEEGYCGPDRPGTADNSECMQTEFIMGSETTCANDGEVITAISANDVICESLFRTGASVNFNCGTENGADPFGDPIDNDVDNDGVLNEQLFATGIVYNRVSNTISPVGCAPP